MDEKKLINFLFKQSPIENRCEYIRKDETGPYCAQGLLEGKYVTPARRLICDTASLQLWCLDKERCNKCIQYNPSSLLIPKQR